MVNLATLTGAILVSLGKDYAGMFSNSDDLSAQLSGAGEVTDEKLWRMPMGEAYDKMLKSHIADMKNIGGPYGGSITAACFLERFVEGTPWAHLDIAGKAGEADAAAPIHIAVPVLRRIANFDDLDPLAGEGDVRLTLVEAGDPIPGDCDLVLLPGSKSTISDLAFLRDQGWDNKSDSGFAKL